MYIILTTYIYRVQAVRSNLTIDDHDSMASLTAQVAIDRQ